MEKERILTYVTGLLYYYGVMCFEDLYQAVSKGLSTGLEREAFRALLNSNTADEDSPFVFERDGDCYYDIEVQDIERVLTEQAKCELAYRPVSEEEAGYVIHDGYVMLWKDEEQRFYRWLVMRCGDDEELALALTLGYAEELKNGLEPLELAKKVIREMELTGMDDVQQAGELILEFSTHTPQWTLKGWSACEVDR
jgi:hypothetical protein